MKVFVVVTLFGLTLALSNSQIAPKITVQQDRLTSSLPKIEITFPDGHKDRIVLKRHSVFNYKKKETGSECNFLGRLEKDRKACLAVTGCPGQEMKFTIHSKHNTETNKYVLHPSGNVEMVPSSMKPTFDIFKDFQKSNIQNVTSLDRYMSSDCNHDDTSGCKALPETMELKLKVVLNTKKLSFNLKEFP